ncbi:hypothetical protein FMUND_4283 [Fusarium mundagurra]|uniref:BTB domain-containing protein n=1 Tax=Fusarium mundagurra TaxID=1567541 RepID=A0A8H6DK53_9HYPO|nr:hypothetical protein FMUND_4283 [Fusarium mundagurra]
MRSITYEIDPQGAIEVVLQDPDTQPTSLTLTTSIPIRPTPQAPVKVKKGEEGEEQDDFSVKMRDLTTLFFGTSTPQRNDKEVQIRMRVSSYHLSLASRILSSLLQHSAEANELYLTGWDAKALATVLNVIHGRNAQVPRNVNFEFLTRVAAVVHHLECAEAVQLLSSFWLSTLEEAAVSHFNSNCFLWLFNSWVFSWRKEFSHCAQLVLSNYRGPNTVILHDLPLTEVLDKIDGMRIVLIKKVFTALESLEQTLSTERGCPEARIFLHVGCFSLPHPQTRQRDTVMSVVTHDIVPDGDICIVLRNPNAVSVIPIVKLRKYGTDPPEYIPDDKFVASPSWRVPALKDKRASEYRFRVSSHHLTAASPVFRTMLNGHWKESVPSKAATSSDVLDQTPAVPIIREISATDWNVHAFVTVLNIIHGRNNEVPRAASIKFVTDVAVIANYYECAESAGTFSSMARLVVEHGEGSEHVDTQDLPIAVIFEKLDKQREPLVPFIYRTPEHVREDLLNWGFGCSYECRSMLFGSLVTGMHDIQKNLGSWDGDEHKGVSVARVMHYWNLIETEWKDLNEKSPVHSPHCNIKAIMQPTFHKIREDFKNIKLADFQAKKV